MKWSYRAIYYDPDVEVPPASSDIPTAEEVKRAIETALTACPVALEEDLNALGADGWELVAVVPGKISDDGRPWVAIFKRPI